MTFSTAASDTSTISMLDISDVTSEPAEAVEFTDEIVEAPTPLLELTIQFVIFDLDRFRSFKIFS